MLYLPTVEESKILREINKNKQIPFQELKDKFKSEPFEIAFEGCVQKAFVKVENGFVFLTENGKNSI